LFMGPSMRMKEEKRGRRPILTDRKEAKLLGGRLEAGARDNTAEKEKEQRRGTKKMLGGGRR